MLQTLYIKNFILIDEVRINFNKGLTVISGETGAGKSIILDALQILLSKKTPRSVKKNITENTIIEAVFANDDKVQNILAEYFISTDNDVLILKKIITKDNKVLAYINDHNVTIKTISEISSLLFEIHGQHDSNNLFDHRNHQIYLDSKLPDQTELLAEQKAIFLNYHDKKKQYDELKKNKSSLIEKLDNLENIALDLDNLKPQQDQYQKLQEEKIALKKIINNQAIYKKLTNDFSAKDGIEGKILETQKEIFNNLHDDKEKFSDILDKIEILLQSCDDITKQLTINDDCLEDSLEEISQRISEYKRISRKYNINEFELYNYHFNLSLEIQELKDLINNCDKLDDEVINLRTEFLEICNKVNIKRHEVAKELEHNIQKILAELYMDKTKFKISFSELAESSWHQAGNQKIIFTVSTNPGQPYNELSKIASGGELSRFMLALKATLLTDNKLLIFDEIDTGISGKVAEAVGHKLANLANHNQTIIITHLPQVASKSNTHIKIIKYYENDITKIKVKLLSEEDKIAEIARMISGKIITDEAKITAQQIIAGG